jgi:cytosine permease
MQSRNQSWISLTSIKVGILICLPAMMLGHILTTTYGIYQTLLGLLLGGAISYIISRNMFSLTERFPHKNTIEIAQLYFNKIGMILYALGSAFALLGWFAIQLKMMASVVNDSIGGSITIITIILGLLITILVAYGIRGIEKCANIGMMFLIPTILYSLYRIITYNTLIHDMMYYPQNFNIKPIIITVSSFLVGILDLPTYYRYAKSRKDALISFGITYFIFFPLVTGIGIITALYIPHNDFVTGFLSCFNSQKEKIWMALFMIIAGWTTNNGNLFSTISNINSIFPHISYKTATIIAGLTGTLIALTSYIDNMTKTLDIMIILMASCGGLILSRITCHQKNMKYKSDIILTLGCIQGLIFIFMNISLTGFIFLDSTITTYILGLILKDNNQ